MASSWLPLPASVCAKMPEDVRTSAASVCIMADAGAIVNAGKVAKRSFSCF